MALRRREKTPGRYKLPRSRQLGREGTASKLLARGGMEARGRGAGFAVKAGMAQAYGSVARARFFTLNMKRPNEFQLQMLLFKLMLMLLRLMMVSS